MHAFIGVVSCAALVAVIALACSQGRPVGVPTAGPEATGPPAASVAPSTPTDTRLPTPTTGPATALASPTTPTPAPTPSATPPTTPTGAPGPAPPATETPTAAHDHAPGTPPQHSHAPPGSVGQALARALEQSLAPATSTREGGFGSGLPAHEESEGLTLVGGDGTETVTPGARCDPAAPVRLYNVVAVNMEITLNRFLDHDPEGRMYVLEEELARARLEEARNRDARADLADLAEPAVSIGLQGDAIQPLTVRVNQGECLRMVLRNDLKDGEPASLHIHGSSLYVAATGAPAVATNQDARVMPGGSVTYEWMVEETEQEGVHYFHSHGVERYQMGHGLFGALIVEPGGSAYIDPINGEALTSGWSAIIRDPGGSDFREFTIYYHEIGSETYHVRNKLGLPVRIVDPTTGAYRPGSRAMNYRSEPFMNRLELQSEQSDLSDISMAYNSYTFGDPATPMARSYLGDPVKTRLVHGGSEVFHVHHTHGGAVRWRRQPKTEDTSFDTGFDKSPLLRPEVSTRLDSQSIGPSESYDLETECGSGGCQESVGDFLIHCHVAHHYVAGMWMIWRVYNTLQVGDGAGDGLPALGELVDRTGRVVKAVTSEQLIGTTAFWKGSTFPITEENLGEWVERQLPPQGVANGYDASVMDWLRVGDLYHNEPESEHEWPNFKAAQPGSRLPILFDPSSGKLAYPLLRPHLGRRPPFAPNHGPAPFLSPIGSGRDPPAPGENGLWSVCPSGTNVREHVIHAINVPIPLNKDAGLIDAAGQLFVLEEEESAVRADDDLKVPLAIRANAGEDCVDILLKSELEDTEENSFFSKVNVHIHLVQFDIQASDGVSAGFAYEQSVRPFTSEGEKVQVEALAGQSAVDVGNSDRFHPGTLVGVGMDQEDTFEIKRISEISGNRIVFDEPLAHAHAEGEIVSAEFVRYRWYPDVQFGTAYFHDHVNALTSWAHGLFGALISEPPGSTYHDPFTGSEVRSGTIVDVRTDSFVSPDLTGSFRELVMFIQDNNPTTQVGRSSGSSLNMRVEPLGNRGDDPSLWFSSAANGDPETPVLHAYLGDPIVIRTLVSATNNVHTWHITGHWFRGERFSPESRPITGVHIGISERYDLIIPAAGGPQGMPGDYPYYNGRLFKLKEGSWGLIRVHEGDSEVGLLKLPGRDAVPRARTEVCPEDAPTKEFDVVVMQARLRMLGGAPGKVYALAFDESALASGAKAAEPLVLRVNVGDCIKVHLRNGLPEGKVTFHADRLAYDPRDSMGISAGANPDQAVAPGETKTYTFFAHPEYGEGAALVRDWANVTVNPGLGLYGGIIVGPRGSRYTHPVTGEDASMISSWTADVHPPDGRSYRDFALFMQDEDEAIGTHLMPYEHAVGGVVGLNYRSQPLAGRADPDGGVFTDYTSAPATPVMEAYAGDPLRIHVLVPHSEQGHVFSIEGHRWPLEPRIDGSDLLSSVQIGGAETLDIVLSDGAGGRHHAPADYLYGDHREPYREAGLWGLLRVHPKASPGVTLQPLPSPD